jgi:glycine/D-amino acid oxidase-like deaminating enzyme
VRLRHGTPLWLSRPSSRRHRRYPTHHGTLDVDVVIVGGGITGAVAAYLFSEAGVRVAVVEARECGRGSTAASTALLMQEPDKDFSDLAARYGGVKARRIWRALMAGARDLTRTIRKLKIKCDLHTRDSIYFTLQPEKVAGLRKEFRDRKRAGLPGRWLSPAKLHELAGIQGCGAILTPGNAEADPLKACAGFLRAAGACGAKIFERSPIRRIITSNSRVTLKTPHGTIRANQVVIATGYATIEFKPLAGRFRLMNTYVIATRRLPDKLRRKLLRARTMLWDTNKPYHYLRWSEDNRLIIGGEDSHHRSARGSRRRLTAGSDRLRNYQAAVYPGLALEEPEYAWEGLFAETPDGLPYIGPHRRYPKHLFALGYGGNGMTVSFLTAQLLLKRYQNRPHPDEELFSFGRSRKH